MKHLCVSRHYITWIFGMVLFFVPFSRAHADVALGGRKEPAMAINPQNSNKMAVADLERLWVSTNGGSSWSSPTPAPLPSGYTIVQGDPSLAFDSQGRLFWIYLGGINILSADSDIFIAQVDPDTGAIIGSPKNVTAGAGQGHELNDKPWLAIGPVNGQDRIHVTWAGFHDYGTTTIYTTFSDDAGETWSAALALSGPVNPFYWPPHNTVASNGDVYVAYHVQTGFLANAPDGTSGYVEVVRSTDGGQTYPHKTIAFSAGNADITPQWGLTRLLHGHAALTQGSMQPWILADPVDTGTVYVVAADDPTNTDHGAGYDDMNVYMVKSTDSGQNWSNPIRVDNGPEGSLQLFPTATIDPVSGFITVMWYDTRSNNVNSDGNFLLDVYTRSSFDGGTTWLPEVKISDSPLDPYNLHRIGEYNGIVGFNRTSYAAVWAGNNGTTTQIIFDRILDGDVDGIPDALDNCPSTSNTDQNDSENDSLGDICDDDDDNDGVSDADEIAAGSDPLNNASTPEVCDGVDNDLNDGVDEGFTNTDGDGMADCVDADDDNDGFSDVAEMTEGSDPLNANSTPEVCDGLDNDLNDGVDEGFTNTDGDGMADCVDADDDEDGIADEIDTDPLVFSDDFSDGTTSGTITDRGDRTFEVTRLNAQPELIKISVGPGASQASVTPSCTPPGELIFPATTATTTVTVSCGSVEVTSISETVMVTVDSMTTVTLTPGAGLIAATGAGGDLMLDLSGPDGTEIEIVLEGVSYKVTLGSGAMLTLTLHPDGTFSATTTGEPVTIESGGTTTTIDPGPTLVMALECGVLPIHNIITGTSEKDYLHGTAGNDLIRGLGGDDRIYGYGGNDCLVGGEGKDLIYGGDGNDILLGGPGRDALHGGSGDDFMEGGEEKDRLWGGAGNDILIGGEGPDWLKGESGDDILDGGADKDYIRGGAGDDTIRLSSGDLPAGKREWPKGGKNTDTLDLGSGIGSSNCSGTPPAWITCMDPLTHGEYIFREMEAVIDSP